jgi:spermidine synthase
MAPTGVFVLPLVGLTRRLHSQRALILLCTFISGAAALIFQVVWQRYLALLVGSEARSISLVIAVFLLGLASGYRYWGARTQRDLSRQALLRLLGLLELIIALYALAFPWLFAIVRRMAYAGPDSLALDLIWTGLLLGLPTFLMGASIPLLTAALPERADEVNTTHARVYGINTLGAFAGALLAGFVLVPNHGLVVTLVIGALADVGVGFAFMSNRLTGASHKAEDVPHIPNRYGRWGIYAYVFITGAVSIALEVLFARVLALSIGPMHMVFPIIVGVVILGLAIGSLTLRKENVSAARVPAQLVMLGVILSLLYLSVPYWPYWFSCIRVSLATIPSNYGVFLTLVLLLTAALLLPVFIPLGRLLPMGYALIDKTRDDYGDICGRVYFANTLGTVAGAVGLGYALFWLFDMPWVFKITLMLPLVLATALCMQSGWRGAAVGCGALALATLCLPTWNRIPHVAGIYRMDTPTDFHFSGLFVIPRREGFTVKMVRDDPGVTVAAFEAPAPAPGLGQPLRSVTVAVNGKSDGNTVGDYSNMVLTGILAYLYSPRERDIDAAIVGLGTGLTTGALAGCEDVRSVTTIEISPGVIEGAAFCNDVAFDFVGNRKSRIARTDAFRFFARTQRQFDIIISEPSNVWVAGLENLFTPEFYQLVNQSLAEDGVFFQWFQAYEIDAEILGTIAANVLDEFPYATLYAVGVTDVGILASRRPLSEVNLTRRLSQAHVRSALEPIGLDDEALLSLLQVYPHEHLAAMAYGELRRRHSAESPWIGPAAGKFRFLRTRPQLGGPVMDDIGRHLPVPARRRQDFDRFMMHRQDEMESWCAPADESRFAAAVVCNRVQALAEMARTFAQPTTMQNLHQQVMAYSSLREQGFIEADLGFLAQASGVVSDAGVARASSSASTMPQAAPSTTQPAPLESPASGDAMVVAQAVREVVLEYAHEWQWDAAKARLKAFRDLDLISDAQHEDLRSEILDIGRRGRERAERLGAALERRIRRG